MATFPAPGEGRTSLLPNIQQVAILLTILGVFAGLVLSYADVRDAARDANRTAETAVSENALLRQQIADLRDQLGSRVETINNNVAYLCNERRRDNVEAGRNDAGSCR